MNTNAVFRLILCTILLPVFAQAACAGDRDHRAGHLKVMTQNLYVGADLFKILEGEPGDVPFKAAEIFGDIQATDFRQRADAIARLVKQQRPHLIGLQEVSLLRTQCPDDIVYPPNNPLPNATDVYADYLQILLDALADHGLDYEVAASVQDVDLEMPVANLGLLDCPHALFDARLTDHDVTLRRSDVDISLAIGANFQANFPVPTPAGTIEFIRGYNIVDASVRGRSLRFVNTHLEVSGNPFANGFQFAQAFELAATLDGLAVTFGDKPLVVVGDFNSDPAYGPAFDCMLPPAFATPGLCPTSYSVMASNGYRDAWTLRKGAFDEGLTCCQPDLLMNAESELYERVDHVWLRPPLAEIENASYFVGVQPRVIGLRDKDKSVDGLWPSDHAGVVSGFTFPRARNRNSSGD